MALLQQLPVPVNVVATCDSVAAGVKAIHQHQPDIVFCDIEMPVLSGLQLLDFFLPAQVTFELIFATAHSQYAVKAFQLSATDYLLKPIELAWLQRAVEKVQQKLNFSKQERFALLKETVQQHTPQRMALPSATGVAFVAIADISYLKADNVYTTLYFADGKNQVVSKPLKSFEQLLPSAQFFRSHRSYLVNLNAIKVYQKTEGGSLLMHQGDEVPIARERRDEFQQRWKEFTL